MTDSSNKPIPISDQPTQDGASEGDGGRKGENASPDRAAPSPWSPDRSTGLGRTPNAPDFIEPQTRDIFIDHECLPVDESVARIDSGLAVAGTAGAHTDSSDFELNNTDSSGRSYEAPKQIGDYQIRDLIGSGGMGNVYLAEHTRMQRMVAIKMLPIERMQSEDAIERFYAEVRAASRLLHPNIVAAFDAGEVEITGFGNVHYLAMEYVEGMTLTQAVASGGPMAIGEAAGVIRQAALGLLHAHRAGITHRDVKPGNLMRARDGTIKVLDLGLARIHSAAFSGSQNADQDSTADAKESSRGRLVGTLPFMSPEQLEDPDRVDARSDIYSLGATMFFLLTASPPFTGEYLDQVYGHRHGEIPNLMEARDDVDLNFAHLFERMMAKSPGHRYQSLDEVIDDLAEYAGQSDTPNWLAEFAHRQSGFDASTVSGGSTSGATARVLGIDLGMLYAAAAKATPDGTIEPLNAGGPDRKLFRLAIASDQNQLYFDHEAIAMRSLRPQSTAHCLQMYIGKVEVARKFAGKACPPEVLLAMMLRRVFKVSWDDGLAPHATAITVPASYDQLHRQSIMQAAQMAGFASIRLVDRSIAAVQSLWCTAKPQIDQNATIAEDVESSASVSLQGAALHAAEPVRHVLFLGVTGQATEVAIVRRNGARLHQLATTGHWHGGTMPWLHRLVAMAAKQILEKFGRDPKSTIRSATHLQIACENAMNTMMIMPSAVIDVEMDGRKLTVRVDRDAWLESCEDLIKRIHDHVTECFKQASMSGLKIDTCVTLGAILRMPSVRSRVLPELKQEVVLCPIDRGDVARGAAACLASELPGRTDSGQGDLMLPPRVLTSHTIGILVEDAKGRRRILPIIPRGTLLPARTNRRLSAGANSQTMKVSLVESSGIDGTDWQTLGRYDIDVSGDENPQRKRTISFDINVNGLLSVRSPMPVSTPSMGGDSVRSGSPSSSQAFSPVLASTKLPALPTSHITEENIATWKQWIEAAS